MNSSQLTIKEIFREEDTIKIEKIYNLVKSCFSELYKASDIVDNLREDISPITYDVSFKHNFKYDAENNAYRYVSTSMLVEGVIVYVQNGDLSISVSNINNKTLYVIISWINANSKYIRYILDIYKKYYSLYTYKDEALPKYLRIYDVDSALTMKIRNDGKVILLYNGMDISDEYDNIRCSNDNIGSIAKEVENNCRRLLPK